VTYAQSHGLTGIKDFYKGKTLYELNIQFFSKAASQRLFLFPLLMAIQFKPGRAAPDDDLVSDPFALMLEAEGREILGQRYDYIANILEEEFEETYLRFFSASILHYEIINLISVCSQLMRETGYPAHEETRFLRYSVIAAIAEYLNG